LVAQPPANFLQPFRLLGEKTPYQNYAQIAFSAH
jgi:hypothetical protein